MSAAQQTCRHLLNPAACQIDLVLDAHLQIADGLMSCQRCGQGYLIELCDIDPPLWCYRISCVGNEAYRRTLRSLGQGSCDLERASNEMFSLRHHAHTVDAVLLRQDGVNHALLHPAQPAPSLPWRQLPCDGTFVRSLLQARS